MLIERELPNPRKASEKVGQDSKEAPMQEHLGDLHAMPNSIPEDFTEWEVICVTLAEWEAIGERFADATHYLERALHKILSQSIVPAVVTELKEAERKRKIEEAVVHRKRSSRIALKETEKEEARAAALRKAEEEEKQARAKRQEARAKKEEAEREKREQAREQRRLEREARERKIQSRNEPKEQSSSSLTSAPAPPPKESSLNGAVLPSQLQMNRNSTPNGVHSPDWVLDCEICRKGGVNIDDGLPMVSCGGCGRWQHINCHDIADRNAGRPKRNWNVGQFLCLRCRAIQLQRLANSSEHHHSARHSPLDQHGWSQSRPQKTQTQPSHVYSQPISDTRYSQQGPYDNRMPYGQQQPYRQSTAQSSTTVYPRTQQSQGITFSHYQPEQHGFSHNLSNTSGWSNGYSTMDSQRFNDQGGYAGAQTTPFHASTSVPGQLYGRVHDPPPYPHAHELQAYTRVPEVQSYNRPHDVQSYNRASQSQVPNGTWSGTPESQYASTSGQRSASHISAAESLAYMQDSVPNLHGWQNTPYVQQSHANGYQFQAS